jgi:hypothetical protein
LTLCLEIDSTKSSQTLDLLSDWKDVKLFKDLAEKDRYVFATKWFKCSSPKNWG